MCAVCVEWEKGKITNREALSALFELANTGKDEMKHLQEVYGKIEELHDKGEENPNVKPK